MTWKDVISNKRHLLQIILSVLIIAGVLWSLTNFLRFIEIRQGIVLPDPLLNRFSPVNLTWLIFGLIYISLILAIIDLVKYPQQFIIIIQSYSLLVLIRMLAMYLMPLNPPADMIPLNDPFVQYFGTGKLLTKDLFFSGHTATLFLLFLAVQNKKLKAVFLACTVIVALSVLLQHVHYAIDVLAAPFFSYSSYKLIILLQNRYLKY